MREATQDDILHGSIPKQILLFFFPIVLGYICQQLYNTIDAMIVGSLVGKEALAAVGGTTGTSINLLVNFIWGLTSGVSVIVAQYYGKRDFDGVHTAVKTGMFLGLVLGAIMTVLGIVVTPYLLNLLKCPEEIYEMSVSYMQIFLAGCIPLMLYNVGASVLRATGDSRRPLYFLILSAIINTILDYVFVKYCHWGVNGAAIATIIAQVICCALMLLLLATTPESFHYELKDFGYDKELLKKSVLLGLPSGIQSVVYSVSNLFIQTSVNSFGTDTIAAYTAFGKIDGFYWNFDGAFGVTCMTLVGQNYGAGNLKRVKESVKHSMIMECIGTLMFTAVSFFLAGPLISLFTKDANVIKIGVDMTRFLSVMWILFVPIEIFSSTNKACGDTLVPMIISATCICVVRISYLLFVPYTTVIEALYCYPISWIIASVAFIIYYYKGNWMKTRI